MIANDKPYRFQRNKITQNNVILNNGQLIIKLIQYIMKYYIINIMLLRFIHWNNLISTK